jgi:hypothetical protein
MPKRPEPEPCDSLSSDEIVTIVNDIRAIGGRAKDRAREAAKRYPEFHQRYPFLFDMVCADDFDYGRFQYMIQMKTRVDATQMTQEQAATKIGQDLFNVYVKKGQGGGGGAGPSS